MTEAAGRVRALVEIAGRCADPGDLLHEELREALIAKSGLSPAGVDLALSKHLETRISDAELAALLASAGRSERCHVVLSAHVCTAALRALVLAVATSPRAFLKPSRRDPILAQLLVREGRRAGLELELTDSIAPQTSDEVHVYGGAAAIGAIRAELPRGVRFRAHGPGFGVAVVRGMDHEIAAEHLVDDVIPFDQRGCLSPRIVLVEHDASGFARVVDRALTRRGAVVPRGTLPPHEDSAVALFRQLGLAVGELHGSATHAVLYDPAPESPLLPPTGRSLLVVDSANAGVLSPIVDSITTVGFSGGAPGVHATLDLGRAKRVLLGTMQRPPLDGPVDARTKVIVT